MKEYKGKGENFISLNGKRFALNHVRNYTEGSIQYMFKMNYTSDSVPMSSNFFAFDLEDAKFNAQQMVNIGNQENGNFSLVDVTPLCKDSS